MATKDWKRDWNIGGEYPEWNNAKKDTLSVHEGDSEDKFSVTIFKDYGKMITIAKNVSEKEALKKAKDYMKSH